MVGRAVSGADLLPPDEPADPAIRRRSAVARWIRGLSLAAYAGLLVAVVAVFVLATALVNPGERVGPVRPADPPVGGPGLPATRLD